MLNSQTIDVALGLALVFLTLSLVVSSINEFVAMVLKTRFTMLRDALESLVGSQTAQAIIDHPAVPAAPNSSAKQPSYIEPSYFAVALLDRAVPNAAGVAKMKAIMDDPQAMAVGAGARDALVSFARQSGGDYGTFIAHVSGWFDAYMDRVSGVYKRQAHRNALIIATAVAVILNVDTVNVYRQLTAQPAYAAAIASNADAVVKRAQLGLDAGTPTLGTQVDTINRQMALIPVPLGWHAGEWPAGANIALLILLKIVGLAITAVAASLGAPFWFDVLGKLSNIRSAGTKPDPSAPQPAPISVPPPAPPPQAAPGAPAAGAPSAQPNA